jgi:hypothetical protein
LDVHQNSVWSNKLWLDVGSVQLGRVVQVADEPEIVMQVVAEFMHE